MNLILRTMFVGFCVMVLLTLPTHLQNTIAPEPLPSYSYLPAPGNRFPCKTWIAGQADSSTAPIVRRCTQSWVRM